MNKFEETEEFSAWLSSLKDVTGKAKILARISRAKLGNFGDHAPVGDKVFEMRIHFGPGYRVYYTRKHGVIYLLLLGGDKSTQNKDIKKAIELANSIEDDESN